MIIEGKAWVFGDNIDTDRIVPGKYIFCGIDETKTHTLESVDPSFAGNVQAGDIVVGGRNFGCGSSRESAARVLRALEVGCVVAESFARIFYRNCIAIGLPILAVPGISASARAGHRYRVDLAAGRVEDLDTRAVTMARPLPERLLDVLAEGGVLPALRRIAASQEQGR